MEEKEEEKKTIEIVPQNISLNNINILLKIFFAQGCVQQYF